MGRLGMLALATLIGLGPGRAPAQPVGDLAGAWTLVSLTAESNGVRSEPYGAHSHGLMIIASGRFSVTIVRAGIPKFASNNRTAGTADENKAAVGGSLGYFGAYSVNAADSTVDMRVEASTYPNFEGTNQKRKFSLQGDELTLTNAAPSGGGGVATQVWKRVK